MSCHMCGVFCTEISISSPIPGMPGGKPAGLPCIHLNSNNLCNLFNSPTRPAVCSSFQYDIAICGKSANEARQLIRWYEKETSPLPEKLRNMGYSLDDLERSNPYNQWMYEK